MIIPDNLGCLIHNMVYNPVKLKFTLIYRSSPTMTGPHLRTPLLGRAPYKQLDQSYLFSNLGNPMVKYSTIRWEHLPVFSCGTGSWKDLFS